ncbi:CIC11C00000005583 [Sungouiella intermedia]|uniref:Amino-acid acetyltransferase, mitochondrial n=1 Tax=Sungouiella intermedia TaxID=45354 RepID=A0A1L0GS37_9ASCO|nr:CIC11C00000005583 [[Candida] intermedia]
MSKLKNLGSQLVSNFKSTDNATKAKRDLILSILKSTTTKREAKNYLQKYQNQFSDGESNFHNPLKDGHLTKAENQRDLFITRFLRNQNPFLNIYEDDETKLQKIPLRIALVKLSLLDESPETWKGVSETFKRLVTLGISPIIILDHDHLSQKDFKTNAAYMMKQGYKLLLQLSVTSDEGTTVESMILRSLFVDQCQQMKLSSLEQLLIPLYQGIIPIVQPLQYNVTNGSQNFVTSNEALYTVCSELLEHPELLTIEKVIVIDKLGGIPSIERNQTSHVYINLSQEYSDIVSELFIGFLDPATRDKHLDNFKTMNKILTLAKLKSATNEATGIITTPEIMSLNDDELNPIIYNVLTDRPIISSSLPSTHLRTPEVSTSIIKKGFEVIVIDEHSVEGELTFKKLVTSGLIDENRIFELMNDSFGRKLDVHSYIERINENLASIIIVGDYVGAAIITWEKLTNGEKVAYLDKFAVASEYQGLPSLADIIFKLIYRCHQSELLWRSRKNNPVNKWYFDRCRGSFSADDSNWKLFFTGKYSMEEWA